MVIFNKTGQKCYLVSFNTNTCSGIWNEIISFSLSTPTINGLQILLIVQREGKTKQRYNYEFTFLYLQIILKTYNIHRGIFLVNDLSFFRENIAMCFFYLLFPYQENKVFKLIAISIYPFESQSEFINFGLGSVRSKRVKHAVYKT